MQNIECMCYHGKKMDPNKLFTSEEDREDGAERNGNKEYERKRNM